MVKNSARSVVAVEFSPSFLKLVEFLPLENQIATVLLQPLEISQWGNDEYLAEQIRSLLQKNIRSEDIDLVCSVSAEHTALRNFEIPLAEDNVLDAIQWDMEQYLARPLDEYLMDYQLMGSNQQENGRTVLTAAYRRSEVERLQRLLESTGYPLAVLDVDTFATINAFEANYPEMLASRTFIIKADAHGIICIRTQNGSFFGNDVFKVNSGILDLNGQAKTDRLLDLVHEIRQRMDETRNEWGELDQVILCGDLAQDEEFRDLIEANSPMPMATLNAFREMVFAEGFNESADGITSSAPQFACVLGLALRRRGDS